MLVGAKKFRAPKETARGYWIGAAFLIGVVALGLFGSMGQEDSSGPSGSPSSSGPSADSSVATPPEKPNPCTKSRNNADVFCAVLDVTKLLSEKCKISTWNETIDISIDTTTAETMKMCTMLIQRAKRNNEMFREGWQLKIFTLYSQRPVATCSLPLIPE